MTDLRKNALPSKLHRLIINLGLYISVPYIDHVSKEKGHQK